MWANCFAVAAKPIPLYKYGLKITKVIPKEEKKAKGFKEPEIRGRKLQIIIAKLLEVIRDVPQQAVREAQAEVKNAEQALKQAQKAGDKKTIAEAMEKVDEAKGRATETKDKSAAAKEDNKLVVSEFKSQIVSLRELHLSHNPVRVALSEEALEDGAPPRQDLFDVELMEAVPVNLSEVLNHVATMNVPKGDNVFPRHPEVVDVLNMIIGFRPRSNMDGVSVVGSSRFYPLGINAQIETLAVSWRPLIAARGFFQSTRLATGRMLLNTQVTHGVFRRSGPATELFQYLQTKPCDSYVDRSTLKDYKALSKCLSKVRALVTFRTASGREVKRVKTIEGLVFASEMGRKGNGKEKYPDRFAKGWELCGPAHVEFWKADENKYVTVKQHFESKFGRSLGDYPLFNFGKGDKTSYFPAEVVEIQPGQQAKLKLTGKETTAMLNFACRSPFSNAETLVNESRERLGHDDPLLMQLGVSVSKSLLAVHARVLVQPAVRYRTAKEVKVQNGSWNMIGICVSKPGRTIEKWACVMLKPTKKERVDAMIKAWQKMDIPINNAPTLHKDLSGSTDAYHEMDDFFKESKSKGVQLIIFILSMKDSGGLYNRIKTLGDCVYGIHTSCIVSKQIDPPDKDGRVQDASVGTLANIGIKVNLKFGGVNHRLSKDIDILKEGKTMFVGYDVTHPTNMDIPKNGNGPPSLVGLVSSIDKELGQWPSVTWEQASRQEILGNVFEGHFASRIDLWQKNNSGKALENIVIYRDGVSESQFSTVLRDELPLIRKACEKKLAQNPPKLTIIVSVKRHQTRFYPSSTDKNDRVRSGNVKNGTVVDRGVTQARYWDFYLTAHDAIKGTARPAHYTVLLDEIFRQKYGQGAANALETVTHELCYCFGRATKAVSICPPAYYADLVCERARAHRPEYAGPDDASELSGSSSHRPAQTREIHENLRDTMYYI